MKIANLIDGILIIDSESGLPLYSKLIWKWNDNSYPERIFC